MKLRTDVAFLVQYSEDFIKSVESSIKEFWPMIYNDDPVQYAKNAEVKRSLSKLAYVRDMLVDLSDIIDEARLANEVFCDEESD